MSFEEGGAEVWGKMGRCSHSPDRVADILLNNWEHGGEGIPLPFQTPSCISPAHSLRV